MTGKVAIPRLPKVTTRVSAAAPRDGIGAGLDVRDSGVELTAASFRLSDGV